MIGTTRTGITISPHRQEYVTECNKEDEIVAFQLDGAVAPEFSFGIQTLPDIGSDRKLTPGPQSRQTGLEGGRAENAYFLGVAGQEQRCGHIGEYATPESDIRWSLTDCVPWLVKEERVPAL